MHVALENTEHRPWPVPATPWTWRQSWRDLLFAHWPVAAESLRSLVPPALAIDEYDGTSWVGVVPLRMADVMRRPLPNLPWISAFPELNLRLYVEHGGKPGVWFLSLDATNPLAVWAAKRFFHLPYAQADIDISETNSRFDFRSRRRANAVKFSARFQPSSEPTLSAPGSLEHWLTERYCLYAMSPSGALFRGEVHHDPWPLQKAEAEIEENELLRPHGFSVNGPPVLLHFSRRLDVIVWSPVRLD